MTEPILLNCTRLSQLLDKSPSFVTAMKRAGYRFRYEAAARTTLAHALEWIRGFPRFNPDRYLGSDWKRRRYPQRGRSIYSKVRAFVINRDGGKCHYCGITERLTVDHIVPFSRGGTHAVRNLLAACLYCNIRKRTMSYAEFMEKERALKQ